MSKHFFFFYCFGTPYGHIYFNYFTVHYIFCGLYGRAAAVPSTVDTPYLCLLPSFSVLACLLAASADQTHFCWCTLICTCCQASLFLLIFASIADEAAAEICSHWSAAAQLPISCTGMADEARACWFFVAWLEGCCCFTSFRKTIVCDDLMLGFETTSSPSHHHRLLDIKNTQCWSTPGGPLQGPWA